MRQVGVIGLAMVLAATGLVAWTGGGRDAISAESGESAREQLNLGVVAIDARIGGERVRGSGTVIDERAGLVVTAAHNVWGATSLRLTTGLGVLHGRVVARAPCAGLALVEIQPRLPGLVALAPASGGPPSPAELLSAVGRRSSGSDSGPESLLMIPQRTAGTVSNARYEPRLPRLEDAIRLDGAVVPESSGGPVVNAGGEVIGMAMATTGSAGQEGALVVPWSTIEARIGELEVDDRRVYVGWRDHYRCAGQMHAYARREHSAYRPIDARINAPVPATRLPGTQELDR